MSKLVVFLSVLFVCALHATYVFADSPVNLDCTIPDGASGTLFHITLNESNQSVSYIIPSLEVSKNLKGVFTSDKVVFDSFQIDRMDLTIIRTVKIFDQVLTDKGTCKLVQPPTGRKF